MVNVNLSKSILWTKARAGYTMFWCLYRLLVCRRKKLKCTDQNLPIAFLVSGQKKQVRLKLIFLVLDKWLLDISNIFGIFRDICNAGLLPLVLETKLSWTYPKPSRERCQAKAKESPETLYQNRLMSCKPGFTPITLLKGQQWWSGVLLSGTWVWHGTGPSLCSKHPWLGSYL